MSDVDGIIRIGFDYEDGLNAMASKIEDFVDGQDKNIKVSIDINNTQNNQQAINQLKNNLDGLSNAALDAGEKMQAVINSGNLGNVSAGDGLKELRDRVLDLQGKWVDIEKLGTTKIPTNNLESFNTALKATYDNICDFYDATDKLNPETITDNDLNSLVNYYDQITTDIEICNSAALTGDDSFLGQLGDITSRIDMSVFESLGQSVEKVETNVESTNSEVENLDDSVNSLARDIASYKSVVSSLRPITGGESDEEIELIGLALRYLNEQISELEALSNNEYDLLPEELERRINSCDSEICQLIADISGIEQGISPFYELQGAFRNDFLTGIIESGDTADTKLVKVIKRLLEAEQVSTKSAVRLEEINGLLGKISEKSQVDNSKSDVLKQADSINETGDALSNLADSYEKTSESAGNLSDKVNDTDISQSNEQIKESAENVGDLSVALANVADNSNISDTSQQLNEAASGTEQLGDALSDAAAEVENLSTSTEDLSSTTGVLSQDIANYSKTIQHLKPFNDNMSEDEIEIVDLAVRSLFDDVNELVALSNNEYNLLPEENEKRIVSCKNAIEDLITTFGLISNGADPIDALLPYFSDEFLSSSNASAEVIEKIKKLRTEAKTTTPIINELDNALENVGDSGSDKKEGQSPLNDINDDINDVVSDAPKAVNSIDSIDSSVDQVTQDMDFLDQKQEELSKSQSEAKETTSDMSGALNDLADNLDEATTSTGDLKNTIGDGINVGLNLGDEDDGGGGGNPFKSLATTLRSWINEYNAAVVKNQQTHGGMSDEVDRLRRKIEELWNAIPNEGAGSSGLESLYLQLMELEDTTDIERIKLTKLFEEANWESISGSGSSSSITQSTKALNALNQEIDSIRQKRDELKTTLEVFMDADSGDNSAYTDYLNKLFDAFNELDDEVNKLSYGELIPDEQYRKIKDLQHFLTSGFSDLESNNLGVGFEGLSKSITPATQALKQCKDALDNLRNAHTELNNIQAKNISSDGQYTKEVEKQSAAVKLANETLQNAINSASSFIGNGITDEQISAIKEQTEQYSEGTEQSVKNLENANKKFESEVNKHESIIDKYLQSQLEFANSSEYKDQTSTAFRTTVDGMSDSLEEMLVILGQVNSQGFFTEDQKTRLLEIEKSLSKVNNQLSNGVFNKTVNGAEAIDAQSIEDAEAYVRAYDNVDQATVKVNQSQKTVTATLKNTDGALQTLTVRYDKLAQVYRATTSDETLESFWRRQVSSAESTITEWKKAETELNNLYLAMYRSGEDPTQNDMYKQAAQHVEELRVNAGQSVNTLTQLAQTMAQNGSDTTLAVTALNKFASAQTAVQTSALKTKQSIENIAQITQSCRDRINELTIALGEQASDGTSATGFYSDAAYQQEWSVYYAKVEEYAKLLSRLHELIPNGQTIVNENNLKEAQKILQKINQLYSQISSGNFNMSSENGALIKATDVNQAVAYLKNLKSVDNATISITNHGKQLTAIMKDNNNQAKTITLSFDTMSNTYRALITNASNSQNIFTKIADSITRSAQYFTHFVSGYMLTTRIISAVKEGIETIAELDTALTEMRKVSDESETSLSNLQQTFFSLASTIGTTAEDLSEATASFMRIGESMEEAVESATQAAILYNVSEFDSIDDAADALVAISQAYDELEKSNIVDIINELGNNYAIATDELAEGLQTVSSTLSLLGVSLEETSALVTTANETIQDASKVATGLRTVALRIFATEESEEELEELGEEVDDFVTATTATRQQIIKDYTAVASNGYEGINIIDEETGVYRDLYDILLDIAEIYEEIQAEDLEFGTNRATALIEVLGGKNRSSIVSALLSNPETLAESLESAENAAGSAEEELSKYLESIEGKTEQLTNLVQQFWSNALSTDVVKIFLDLANAVMEDVNAFVELQGVIPTVVSLITTVVSMKNLGIYSPVAELFSSFAESTGIKSTFEKITDGLLDTSKVSEDVSDVAQDLADAWTDLGGSGEELAGGTEELIAKTNILNVALNAATAYLIAMAVQTAIEFVYALATAEDRLADAVTDANNAISEAEETVEDYKDRIAEQQAILEDETSTQEEAVEARSELLSIQDELIESYGSETDVVESVTEAIWGNVDALDALAQAEYEAQKQSIISGEDNSWIENLGDSFLNYVNGYDDNLDRILDIMSNGINSDSVSGVFRIDLDADDANSTLDNLLSKVDGLTKTEFSDGSFVYTLASDTTLSEQIDALAEAQEILSKYGADIETSLDDILLKLQDYYDRYGDFFDTWVGYDADSPLQQYEDELDSLADAYSDYLTAIINDDSNTRANALSEFFNQYISLQNTEGVEAVVLDYLEQLYATIMAEMSTWEFDQALSDSSLGLTDKLESAFDKIGTISSSMLTDILNGDYLGNTQWAMRVSESLQPYLDEYGMSVDEFVEKLVELGYVASDAEYDLVQAFSSDEIDSLGDDLTYALQLTQEEIDACNGDFDKLLEKIKEVKAANYEAAKSSSSITDVVSTLTDQIEPVFESLADAYTSIWDEDTGFSLDIDNSVLEGVRSAFDDLDDDISEAFDTDVLDDFLSVLADTTSSSEDVQDAFNALATEYINAAGLLDVLNEDTVDYVATQLKNIGVTNAEEVALSLLAQKEAEAIDETYDLSNATDDEIIEFMELQGVSQETIAQLALLKLAQIEISDNPINEAESISQVLALGKAAGVATEMVLELQQVQDDIASGSLSDAGLTAATNKYKQLLAEYEEELNNFTVDIDFDGWSSTFADSSSSSSSSSDASDTADEYVDAYEEAKEKLQTLRDRDEISEREYLRRLRVLYSQYYADVEDYSDEFFEEQREYLEEYKEYYDGVIEYIIDIYEDQIDDLEDECDDVVEALEDQQEAAHDAYQAQIDEIEDLIDALDDQIDAYDKQIKQLEKQQKVYEKQIDALEDQIDAYDDEIEELEDQIDAYDDQIEAIEKIQEEYEDEIELLEEKQEALEDVIEEYEDQIEVYEDMIDAYQEQIDAIQDEIDALEDANDERERELALQEALYNLEQAKNQKTNLVYSAESGYTYQADDEAIKEAEDALYEAQLDITVAALEKEIDALEELQDSIQDEIDLIEDQIEAIEDQIDELQDQIEVYEDMIDALDDEIEAIEDLQEAIEDQIEEIEELQEALQDQIDLIQDQIDAIEDQIEVIEEYQDAIQEQIDLYEEQVDDLNDMMDDTDDYFDDLIDTTKKFYEEQEKAIQVWIDEFTELLGLYDDAVNRQNLLSAGFTEEDILGMTIEDFAAIETEYIGILTDMSNGNAELQQQISELGNVNIAELNGHLTETNQQFSEMSGVDLSNAINASQSLRDGFLDAKSAVDLLVSAVGGDATGLVDMSGTVSNASVTSIVSALQNAESTSDVVSAEIIADIQSIIEQSEEYTSAQEMSTEELYALVTGYLASGTEDISGAFAQISEEAITTQSGIITEAVEPLVTTVESSNDELSEYITGTNDAISTDATTTSEEIEKETTDSAKTIEERLEELASTGETVTDELQSGFEDTTSSIDDATSRTESLIEKLKAVPSKVSTVFETIYTTVTSAVSGSSNFAGTVGNAYASGYSGLKRDEKNALRSEYGQAELTVYPDGTYELTDEPVISDLPKDTVIFNEDQTKRIMRGGSASIGQISRSFAGGTITELDPSNVLITAMTASILTAGTKIIAESGISDLTNAINNIETKSSKAQAITQTFNITMPNVTDGTSAEKLMRDLQLIASKKVQYFG